MNSIKAHLKLGAAIDEQRLRHHRNEKPSEMLAFQVNYS